MAAEGCWLARIPSIVEMNTFVKEVRETKSLLSEQKRESEVIKTYMVLSKSL